MNIRPLTVRAFEITGTPGLDPIQIYLQDLPPIEGLPRGRVTLQSSGGILASCSFGLSLGRTLEQFVREVGMDYLVDTFFAAPGSRILGEERQHLLLLIKAVQDALKQQAALEAQACGPASGDHNQSTPPSSTRTPSRVGRDGWVIDYHPGPLVDPGPREPSLRRRRGDRGGGLG